MTGRRGRQLLVNRLGIIGFDGGRAMIRPGDGLEAERLRGYGLARATALPVSSSALNPLDDFQPRSRQLVAGGALGWSGRTDKSARIPARGGSRLPPVRLGAGRPLGEAEALLPLESGRSASTTWPTPGSETPTCACAIRPPRYRTGRRAAIPAPLRSLDHLGRLQSGALPRGERFALGAAVARLELRGRWERYAFSPTETATPLADVDNDGWRFGVGASFRPNSVLDPRWGIPGGIWPGASVPRLRGERQRLAGSEPDADGLGSTLDRPLEFRFEETGVDVFGLDAEWRPSARVRLALGGAHYAEDRRPAGRQWHRLESDPPERPGHVALGQRRGPLAPFRGRSGPGAAGT